MTRNVKYKFVSFIGIAVAFGACITSNSGLAANMYAPLSESEQYALNKHCSIYSTDIVYCGKNNPGGTTTPSYDVTYDGYIEYLKNITGYNPSMSQYYTTQIRDGHGTPDAMVGHLMFALRYVSKDTPDYFYDVRLTPDTSYIGYAEYLYSGDIAFAYDFTTKGGGITDYSAHTLYPTNGNVMSGDVDVVFETARPTVKHEYGDAGTGYFMGSNHNFCILGVCQSNSPIIYAVMPTISGDPTGTVNLNTARTFLIPTGGVESFVKNTLSTLDSTFPSGMGYFKHNTMSGKATLDRTAPKLTSATITSNVGIKMKAWGYIWLEGAADFTLNLKNISLTGKTGSYDADVFYDAHFDGAEVISCKSTSGSVCPQNLRVSKGKLLVGGKNADKLIVNVTIEGDYSVTGGTTPLRVEMLSTITM